MRKIIILLLFPFISFSQNNDQLTLEECIKIAQNKSTSAKIARHNLKNKQLNYDAFNSSFLPQLYLSANVPGLSRRITQIRQNDGTFLFRPISQLNSSGGLSLYQNFVATGTQITLFSGLTRYDQLEYNEFSQWGATPFQISISQPLFKHNSLLWNNEIEKLKYKKSQSEYIEEMENIAREATQKFFNIYIAQMNLQNAEFNVANNDTLYTLSQGRYKVGTIAENDLLQSELALLNSKNDLENAKLELNIAIEELKLYLDINIDNNTKILPPLDFDKLDIPVETAINEAIKNRPIIVDLDIKQLESDMNLNYTRKKYGFSATITAGFGYNQSSEVFQNVYKDLYDQQDINISLEIPLFLWGKSSSEIEVAMNNREDVENLNIQTRKKLEIDLRYEISRFLLLQNQVEISKKSETIATRRFDVARNRYIIGKIDLTQLFIAQSEKDNSFRSYIQTLKNYWESYYRMRMLTLYDFEKKKLIEY